MDAIESGIIEGKVITGGVAQSVEQKSYGPHVRLTLMPGVTLANLGMGRIDFPEPVTVQAGQYISIEVVPLDGPASPADHAYTDVLITQESVITNIFPVIT